MEIIEILDALAANNSRNFKREFLEQHKDNQTLRQVVFMALDPFTQFYIRKIPKYEQIGTTDISLSEAISQLHYLSQRIYTGNKAIDHLRDVLSNLPPQKAAVIERIIQKDLKCGVSTATANEVWMGLIKDYPCMLCSQYEQKLVDKIQYPAYVQLKMDGMRFNAIVRDGKCEFRSRNGKEIQLLGNLEQEFIQMAGLMDVVFDGELLVMENGQYLDRQTGNGILNKASKGTISKEEAEKVCAVVWDAIPYMYFESGEYNKPYAMRYTMVDHAVKNIKSNRVNMVLTELVNNFDEANEIFQRFLAAGQEGIILKDPTGIWEDKRSKTQIKFKGELECDMLVTGIEEGRGKYQGKIGALIAESADGLVKVSVGSGLSDEFRTSMSPEELIGRIISIKYNARIQNKNGDHSLFLPIFIELRSDKSTADHSKDIK